MNGVIKAYKVGGIRLVICKFTDRILHTSLTKKFFVDLQKNCKPSSYGVVLKKLYLSEMNKELNLSKPVSFSEKIQWLKLYESTPLKTRLADKYLVREWIIDKIGADYLIPLIGVYDRFEDINFEELPNQFVIKANHGSGMVYIVKDKSSFDIDKARKKCKEWLNTNFAFECGLELQYKDITPKLLIEQYMVDESGLELKDYKIWCFNGEPKFVAVDTGRFSEHYRNLYDVDWNMIPHRIDYNNNPNLKIVKPKGLNTMINVARILSKEFKFVRVDLYSVNDKIYFGEMTFTPRSGYPLFFGDEQFDKDLGQLITLD